MGRSTDLGGGVSGVLRRRYGASFLHLVGHLLALGIAAYAASRVLHPRYSRGLTYLVWLVGGAVLHDLVLVPAYSIVDGLARRVPLPPGALNHLRFPALVSGAMLLVYWPLILVRADGNYVRATGRHAEGFATRWLLLTAGLFLTSAALYAARAGARARAARRPRGAR
jgi:hypothetical protein